MKNILFALMLTVSSNLLAQEFVLTKSEMIKDSKKNGALLYSLEDNDGGLVIIRSYYGGLIPKLKGYYIQYFDENLKLKQEAEYEVDNNEIKSAFIKNNTLHFIEYEHDKKEDEVKFSAVSANLIDLNFSKKEILSFSDDFVQKYFGFSLGVFTFSNTSQMDNNHLGEVILSSNKNYIVINFDVNDKKTETHKIFVFNSDFEKQFEKTITKDTKDKFFEYNSIDIDDNDGTVYFLGKTFENKSKKTKKDGEANYHFDLYKVNTQGQQSISFKEPNQFISSLELIKSKGNLSAVGFYGNRDSSRFNGVCLFNMNPSTLQITTKKFTPFSEEFLTDKYAQKEGKKNRKEKKGIENIDFKSVFKLANGDIMINAEEFYIQVVTTQSMNPNGGMRTSTRTIYHYKDIMSVRLDASGNLIWSRNINKNQINPLNSSFTSITVNDNSYFFINASDNIRSNKLGNLYFGGTSSKKSNLYVIKVDIDGNVSYEKLVDDKDSKIYYKVNNGNVNLDQKTVTFMGKRKKFTGFLKIKIN